MSKEQIDYKGTQGKLIMMGTKEKVSGWRGELYVACIQYGAKDEMRYDVVPDSTHPADVELLPDVQTFSDKGEAMRFLLELDRNKGEWK